jgi:hypothetical protein
MMGSANSHGLTRKGKSTAIVYIGFDLVTSGGGRGSDSTSAAEASVVTVASHSGECCLDPTIPAREPKLDSEESGSPSYSGICQCARSPKPSRPLWLGEREARLGDQSSTLMIATKRACCSMRSPQGGGLSYGLSQGEWLGHLALLPQLQQVAHSKLLRADAEADVGGVVQRVSGEGKQRQLSEVVRAPNHINSNAAISPAKQTSEDWRRT